MKNRISQRVDIVPSAISAGWLLKSCPKCGGDMYYNVEPDGEYIECLQCAYEGDAMGEIQRADPKRIPGYRKFLSQLVESGLKRRARIRRRRKRTPLQKGVGW